MGNQTGGFENGSIGEWLEDATAVFDEVTEGPVTLVGSSMGAWIAARLAQAPPGPN